MTLPFLAYAGIPYHVLGVSCGAVEAMSLWSRSAIVRSDGGMSAILARHSASASALLPLAFRSLISSFMAAFSSAVNTWEAALRAGVLVAGIGTSPYKVLIIDAVVDAAPMSGASVSARSAPAARHQERRG